MGSMKDSKGQRVDQYHFDDTYSTRVVYQNVEISC